MPFGTVAPQGAKWEFIEKENGKYPILVWTDTAAALDHYGEDGVNKLINVVTLRTICLGIATRYNKAGKSPEEAAQSILAYRPGQRKGGTRTPKTRLRAAADAAVEATGDSAIVTEFLRKMAAGEVDMAALAGVLN